MLAELLAVLQRDTFRRYVTIDEIEQYLASLASDPPDPEQIARDPNDDYLIALAREAAADLIISDADLLVLDEICALLFWARQVNCGRPNER